MKDWKAICITVACFVLLAIVGFQLWKGMFILKAEQIDKLAYQFIVANEKQLRKREEMNFISRASTLESTATSNQKLSVEEFAQLLTSLETNALSLAPFFTQAEIQRKLDLVVCIKSAYSKNVTDSSCVVEYSKTVNTESSKK
ncbi:TPA: hypothetical protein N2674_002486 [Vibrio parahaemolyticus]|nr:hypothetical protein [Vibrio parahaemolyticus]HCG5839730.1 hypothetical protein [Vibrio parahaemolyticus]HCM0477664.1 hypothetical protein [Vibrio parahaemolyticus]